MGFHQNVLHECASFKNFNQKRDLRARRYFLLERDTGEYRCIFISEAVLTFFFPSWQGQCLKRDLIFFLPALGPPQLLAGGLSRGWHCTRARAAPCQGSAASCAAWQSLAHHKTGLYKTKPIPLPAEACVQRLAQPAEQQAVVTVSTAGHRAQHPAGAHSGLIAGTLAPLTASTGRCHLCH